MINNSFFVERRFNGKPIVIDLAKLPDWDGGCYEVMALDKSGHEYDCVRTRDFASAVREFDLMVARFPETESPLKGRYAKLRDDLKLALDKGRIAEDQSEGDGGACNLDSLAVYLPRWNAELVKRAAKEAGTSCWKDGKKYVFHPNTAGQGYKRTDNAETMTQTMRGLGYEAFTRYWID